MWESHLGQKGPDSSPWILAIFKQEPEPELWQCEDPQTACVGMYIRRNKMHPFLVFVFRH